MVVMLSMILLAVILVSYKRMTRREKVRAIGSVRLRLQAYGYFLEAICTDINSICIKFRRILAKN